MDNDLDSAFLYLNRAKDLYQKRNDSFGLGKTYAKMAIVQERAGDNFGSVETGLLATKFLKEEDTAQYGALFLNYNNLGVSCNNLKNYADAKRFYRKAAKFVKNPIHRLMVANNMAIVFHNEKQYGQAVDILSKLLDSVGSQSKYYPKLLLNFSRSKWYQDRNYNPVKNYLKAEKLSQNFDDDWTKDAAYAYLASYYLNKNNDSARLYANKMLDLAYKLKYPTDQLEALQILIKISGGSQVQKYFDTYCKIQDELITKQNRAKNQFALIRFESEKMKVENLNLQKQKTIIEYKVLRQKIINIFMIILIIILAVTVFWWSRRKRQRLIAEANQRLQEQRLDFSKKVHDVVANGIYEVMATIENQPDVPRKQILDKLELMYEKSRDLSYDNDRHQEFNEKISSLVSSFHNAETKVVIIGNDPDFWKDIDGFSREELFQIIRELLVNIKKHSNATQVILKFVNEEGAHEIRYADNGVGLPENFPEKNGLKNIKARLKQMEARLEIEESQQGLKMVIKLKKENVQ